jgi:hypothetical protein
VGDDEAVALVIGPQAARCAATHCALQAIVIVNDS